MEYLRNFITGIMIALFDLIVLLPYILFLMMIHGIISINQHTHDLGKEFWEGKTNDTK